MKQSLGTILASASLLSLLACGVESPQEIDNEVDGEPEVEAPTQEEQPALTDGEDRFGEGVVLLADLRVGDSRFLFLQVAGADGQPGGVATIDQIGPMSADPSEHPALANASALELFWALTSAEMEVPAPLLALGGDTSAERGWFLDEALSTERTVARAACNDSDFRSSLRNWRPAINDGERFRLNTGVGDGSDWFGPTCGTALPCDTPSFYSLYNNTNSYSIFNVDEMKQQVAICNMNPSRTVCSSLTGQCISHLGPVVKFQFRREGNASTGQVFSRDMTASDLNSRWRWRWNGNPDSANWDWRIKITQVKQGDSFDLGWIWEHRGW